jgi:flagellar hook-associated protein 3 FlgL
MIAGLNASGLQFVNNINNLQEKLSDVQAELSSGLKVNNVSDAPDQVSPILQLHASIAQNQQVQNNLTTTQGEVNTADSAVSNAITLLDQAQTLATQGLGTNQTAATRATLSSQVAGIMQQMVSISQTQMGGKYIFSGDGDQSPSYQYNASSPTGVDRLQVSTSTRQAQDANGNTFSVSMTANQLFDVRDSTDAPTTGNVFAALNNLRVALNNNDTAAIQQSQAALSDASNYLNTQQGFYGSVENHISSALTNAQNASVSMQQDLSNRQDADATSDIVQMQQYLTNLQAAMLSEAKMPQQSLFNELQ